MKETKVLKKNSNIVTRQIENETILLPLCRSSDEISYLYSFNQTAARFWELIDGKKTLREIKNIFLDEFDIGETFLTEQIEEFLKDLVLIKAIK